MPQKFAFRSNTWNKKQVTPYLRNDIIDIIGILYINKCCFRVSYTNVYTVGCLHAGTKIVGKIMVLGGIIVVEAESCHGRVEIYAPITIEIHFHNYLTTARITACTRALQKTLVGLIPRRDIPFRVNCRR